MRMVPAIHADRMPRRRIVRRERVRRLRKSMGPRVHAKVKV
jgi:hypothetical protein